MKIGALHFLERGTNNGDPARHWVVAAWHWRWSITWRWLLWWSPWWKMDLAAPCWMFRGNYGGHFVLRLPVLGEFYFAWQRNMPWRNATSTASGRSRISPSE